MTRVEDITVSVLYTMIGTICFIVNVTVLVAIYRAKLLWKGEPIYILSTAAIIDPTIRSVYVTLVLSPLPYFKYTIVPKHVVDALTTVTVALFLQFSTIQLFIATNRYFMVTNNSLSAHFTRRFYVLSLIVLVPVTQLTSHLFQMFLPCCRNIFDPYNYMFIYENPRKQFNYFNALIFGPWCTCATIVPIFCYMRIYFITRKRKLTAGWHKNTQNSPRTLEYCLGFLFYAVFFFGLEVVDFTQLIEYRVFNVITFVFGMFDIVAISLVQVTLNNKVRRSVLKLLHSTPFGIGASIQPSSSIQTSTIAKTASRPQI